MVVLDLGMCVYQPLPPSLWICDCKVYDDYYYSKALYENSVETDKWAYKSFNILNQNGEEIAFVCMQYQFSIQNAILTFLLFSS